MDHGPVNHPFATEISGFCAAFETRHAFDGDTTAVTQARQDRDAFLESLRGQTPEACAAIVEQARERFAD